MVTRTFWVKPVFTTSINTAHGLAVQPTRTTITTEWHQVSLLFLFAYFSVLKTESQALHTEVCHCPQEQASFWDSWPKISAARPGRFHTSTLAIPSAFPNAGLHVSDSMFLSWAPSPFGAHPLITNRERTQGFRTSRNTPVLLPHSTGTLDTELR